MRVRGRRKQQEADRLEWDEVELVEADKRAVGAALGESWA